MSLASTLAGMAFSNAILGAVHAMAHALGGLKDLPHGQCNAILLDKVMEANFNTAYERYLDVGRAIGATVVDNASREENRSVVVGAVRELKRKVGMTASLGELGVQPEELTKLAGFALQDACMATNPSKLGLDEVIQVYEKALG